MKILVWAPFGAGTHYWGPGTSAYRLYRKNSLPDVEVTLVHASDEQQLFPEVFKEQIRLPSFRNGTYLDMIRYFIAAKKWIKKNHNNYDVVHGISAFEYTFRPMLQFASYGVPVFVKLAGEHGGFGNNSRLSIILGIATKRKHNANKLTGFISISNHITMNLLKHGIKPNRIFEIPNGVDISRFYPLGSEEKVQMRDTLDLKNILTFIYVGGLTYNKRVIEIVKAFAELKMQGIKDFQFLIVGPDRSNGWVEKEIYCFIKDNKLESDVIHVNHTLTPEKYLQSADVFLLVSETEGLSNALLEAMSCGLATIVTPISGSVDLVENNINGFFCDGSSNDIKDKIHNYMMHEHLVGLFGNRNRLKIETDYSDTVIFNKHMELFRHYEGCK